VFSTLFSECLLHARTCTYDDVVRSHALETLSIVIRWVLAKNLAGWEVMEVFAGGVDESDKVFMVSRFCLFAKDTYDRSRRSLPLQLTAFWGIQFRLVSVAIIISG